ncbi:response regulator transcription factor [Paraburkholderia sp. A1RI_3L]|uniref:response regulator transcription factor n=1 Tax=Paraburkholderia TaxID=1822464 RepID=UPI003B81ECDC
MHIFILDEDSGWLELARNVLSRAGHRCHLFRRGRDLTEAMGGHEGDLVMLGHSSRDMPGEEVLRWIRSNCRSDLPVLLTAERATPGEVVQMLNAGADDFVIRPVDPDILVARVSALLRRCGGRGTSGAKLEHRDFLFDLKEEHTYRRGQYIALSRKQFQVAVLFFRNVDKPLSRAHMLESVWKQSDSGVRTRTVDTHVWAVRSRLSLRPENGYLIVPLYGYGYRLEDLAQKDGRPAGKGRTLKA